MLLTVRAGEGGGGGGGFLRRILRLGTEGGGGILRGGGTFQLFPVRHRRDTVIKYTLQRPPLSRGNMDGFRGLFGQFSGARNQILIETRRVLALFHSLFD